MMGGHEAAYYSGVGIGLFTGICVSLFFASVRSLLARRRSTTPPGEGVGEPRLKHAESDFTADQIAIAVLDTAYYKILKTEDDPTRIMIMVASARDYLERRTRIHSWGTVSKWWLRKSAELLLVGRSTADAEGQKPTEAKISACEFCETTSDVQTLKNGHSICSACRAGFELPC